LRSLKNQALNDDIDVRRELSNLRQQLRRYQVSLGWALVVFGIGTLVSLALTAFYAFRLASTVTETRAGLAELERKTEAQLEDLTRGVVRQQDELAAIRNAATEDLQAIREAQRRLAEVQDPARDLTALRDANRALWNALAHQRAELLEELESRETVPVPPAPATPAPRFRLDATSYVEPGEPGQVKGFVPGEQKIHRASALPSNPALLLIELLPEGIRPGEPYRLSVRLVNQSNRPIVPSSLRLDWSFDGMNTGGSVALGVDRIEPQKSALLHAVDGDWTEAHQAGKVRVTATLTLDDGARLSNSLHW
jgi:hypothetical protein